MYCANYSFGLRANAIGNQYIVCNNIPIRIYIGLGTEYGVKINSGVAISY